MGFYTTNCPTLKFSNLSWFTSQVTELLLRNRTSVNYRPNFSGHPVGKTMRWIKKMNCYLFDDLDELYHRAKFGEDRTTRAGCRCENVVFVCFLSRSESGALCVRGVHSSNKHFVVVYRPVSTRFSPCFQKGLLFSFRCTTQFSFSSLDGATLFVKLRSKIAKSPKIGGQVCAHHFV